MGWVARLSTTRGYDLPRLDPPETITFYSRGRKRRGGFREIREE